MIDQSFILLGGGPSPEFLANRAAEFGSDYVARLLTSIPEPALPPLLSLGIVASLMRGRRLPV
jgi:hypothetical protein